MAVFSEEWQILEEKMEREMENDNMMLVWDECSNGNVYLLMMCVGGQGCMREKMTTGP